jgi:Protein of unknown function (DUF3311)
VPGALGNGPRGGPLMAAEQNLDQPDRVVAESTRSASSRWWYALLALPFIGLLWVPIYAQEDPELWGFPFFYWYQFAWVPVTSLLTFIVYRKVR